MVNVLTKGSFTDFQLFQQTGTGFPNFIKRTSVIF